MARVCSCGLLKNRKFGTSTVDGFEVCNNCGLPLEFRSLGSVTPGEAHAADNRDPADDPGTWVVWGAMLLIGSFVLGIIAVNSESGVLAVISGLVSLIAFFVILVGAIAKGVAIGIAVDRKSRLPD